MRNSLGVIAALFVAAGCPPPPRPVVIDPPPTKQPARPSASPRTYKPLTPRPMIRRPPFSIALTLAGPAEPRRQLGELLRRALRRSAVFVIADAAPPSDEPGSALVAAHTLGQVRLAVEGDGYSAHATITLPGTGAGGVTARRVVRARQLRRLALKLAAEIHRHHLDTPGPFLSKVAFVARQSSRERQIFVVDFDGGGLRRASTAAGLNILPTWSRGGDLVFTSYATGSPQLVLAGVSGQQVLPRHGGLNSGASFSPDGQRIAVTISRGNNTDIYTVGRDGRLLQRLTRHRALDLSPSWSPDGQQIAFVSDRSGSPQIYLLSLDGSKPRRLTFSGGYNQEPAWCPRADTKKIAYSRRYAGERYAIWVIDLGGGKTVRLTSTRGVSKRPSWSPDCRLLVYARAKKGLWLVTADGKQQTLLHGAEATTPAWSPTVRIEK